MPRKNFSTSSNAVVQEPHVRRLSGVPPFALIFTTAQPFSSLKTSPVRSARKVGRTQACWTHLEQKPQIENRSLPREHTEPRPQGQGAVFQSRCHTATIPQQSCSSAGSSAVAMRGVSRTRNSTARTFGAAVDCGLSFQSFSQSSKEGTVTSAFREYAW